jgi:hypothetical protein
LAPKLPKKLLAKNRNMTTPEFAESKIAAVVMNIIAQRVNEKI